MKKLLKLSMFAAMAMAMSSCASKYMPKFSQTCYFVDYREAADGKVFITESNSVSFEYDPVGSILVKETDGHVKVQKKNVVKDPIYGDYQTYESKGYRYATAQSALDYVANKAIEMGGDAIINLEMHSYKLSDYRDQLVISGMVIKRK